MVGLAALAAFLSRPTLAKAEEVGEVGEVGNYARETRVTKLPKKKYNDKILSCAKHIDLQAWDLHML